MPLASDSVAKKPDSPFFFLVASRLKYASLMEPYVAPFKSTFVLVAMQKRWLTRWSGTPLTAYGPVTSSKPLSSCFRKTTRRPRNRPARRMSTVPGTMFFFSLVGFWDFFTLLALATLLPPWPKVLFCDFAWPACPMVPRRYAGFRCATALVL